MRYLRRMNPTRRAYLELHLAVLLYGFTAILGDLIELSALVLVWWRVMIVTATLFFVVRAVRLIRALPRQLLWQFAGVGILVGLHWLCFYGSIKLANASISLITMATTSFFTALLEPLFFRRKIRYLELLLGLLIVPGMMLIARGADPSMYAGIVVGLLSALLAASFSVFNKMLIDRAEPLQITFLELGSAWLFLCCILPFVFLQQEDLTLLPTARDLGLLLVLALLCTILAYWLNLRALKHLSAFASTLTINLEPVYGILLAVVLLKEHQELGTEFYWGGLLILASVFAYPVLERRFGTSKSG